MVTTVVLVNISTCDVRLDDITIKIGNVIQI